MAPKFPVSYVDPHFGDRFGELPEDAKREALRLLGIVANSQPLLGQGLGFQHATGNLGDCRKLYFDTSSDVEPRFRLVYRVVPDEYTPAAIEVITVGSKYTFTADGRRDTVYVRVGELLGRLCE